MNPFPLQAFTDNYIWLLINKTAGFIDCIDPGDPLPVLDFLSEKALTLRSILITHHHQDHIGGLARLSQTFPACKIFGPVDSRIPGVKQRVEPGDLVNIEPYHFHIVSNPGHTSTHISYYEPHKGWLFCGDTLFSAGCGRVFDGTLEQLHQSLLLFKKLPPATKVFCAHEYTQQNLGFALQVEPHNKTIKNHIEQIKNAPSTCSLPSSIGLECDINPFLRTDRHDVQNYALSKGAVSTESLEVFRTLRQQKDEYK